MLRKENNAGSKETLNIGEQEETQNVSKPKIHGMLRIAPQSRGNDCNFGEMNQYIHNADSVQNLGNQRNFSDKAIGILKSQSSADDIKLNRMTFEDPATPQVPFKIVDKEGNYRMNFTGQGVADSDITRFRETNNLTNADLIMEVKYSNSK